MGLVADVELLYLYQTESVGLQSLDAEIQAASDLLAELPSPNNLSIFRFVMSLDKRGAHQRSGFDSGIIRAGVY